MESGMFASFTSKINVEIYALSIQKSIEALEISLQIAIHQGDMIFEKRIYWVME
jgi:hypothetical protein